jgi:hypothetical protein
MIEGSPNGVVVIDGHNYVVGVTKDDAAHGSDGILFDVDLNSGVTLGMNIWGGTVDDEFNGISFDGTILFAVGSTKSIGARFAFSSRSRIPCFKTSAQCVNILIRGCYH